MVKCHIPCDGRKISFMPAAAFVTVRRLPELYKELGSDILRILFTPYDTVDDTVDVIKVSVIDVTKPLSVAV